MLAKINGMFRLIDEAEIKYAQSGMAILKLRLACSEKYKDKETKLYLDATAFSKPAEIIHQYAGRKGTQIFLSGKLQTESWVDQNQQNRSKVTMIIESWDFVGSSSEIPNNSQNQAPHQQQSYQHPQQDQRQVPSSDSVPVIDIDEDEIPF